MIIIFRKQHVKQAVGRVGGQFKIMVIPNKYKDTLDNFIDGSDLESLDHPGPINEGSRNARRSENSSTRLLKGGHLDENVSDKSTCWAHETEDSQVHQHHNVALFGLKSKRVQYGKCERDEEDGKD